MEKVKQLSIFFTDVNDPNKDEKTEEFEEMVEFVKKCGFLPEEDSISFLPVFIEFSMQKEMTVDDGLNPVCEIEAAGKYDVTEFRFCTEYGGFDGEEPPYAGIYVTKK